MALTNSGLRPSDTEQGTRRALGIASRMDRTAHAPQRAPSEVLGRGHAPGEIHDPGGEPQKGDRHNVTHVGRYDGAGNNGRRLVTDPGVAPDRTKAAGLDRSTKDTTSASAKKLLANGDYAKDFARMAKETYGQKGLTKAQRASFMQNRKTEMAIESGDLTGDAAEQAKGLSRMANEKGLTSSQRAGYTDAADQLVEGAVAANSTDMDSVFAKSLLDFLDLDEDSYRRPDSVALR